MKNHTELYADFLKDHINLKRPLTVVADASNGTAGIILKALGTVPNLNLILINDTPDSDFPAHGPNPLLAGATDQAAKAVVENKADLGVVFDADGDRAFFVDEKGRFIPAYITATILFEHSKPPFVAEELVYKCLEHMGITKKTDIRPSRVGTYFVKQILKQATGTIGAEYSGHYYFKDFFNTDSGIFTMISLANNLSSLDMSISAYIESLPKHATSNEDIKLGDKAWPDIEAAIRKEYTKDGVTFETREGLTIDFGDRWINIRRSNTEPLLRFFAGATTEKEAADLIASVKKLV